MFGDSIADSLNYVPEARELLGDGLDLRLEPPSGHRREAMRLDERDPPLARRLDDRATERVL